MHGFDDWEISQYQPFLKLYANRVYYTIRKCKLAYVRLPVGSQILLVCKMMTIFSQSAAIGSAAGDQQMNRSHFMSCTVYFS